MDRFTGFHIGFLISMALFIPFDYYTRQRLTRKLENIYTLSPIFKPKE